MKRNGKEKIFTKKDVIIRIIIVAILLGVGIFFMGRAAIGVFAKKPGWEVVTISRMAEDEYEHFYPYYGDIGVKMYYATTDERRQYGGTIESIVNEDLAYTSKLTDANFAFKDVKNIQYINEHPGEEVVVDVFLYDTLKDAYGYSIRSHGAYNIFAGLAFETWWDYFYSETYPSDETMLSKLSTILPWAKVELEYMDALVFNDANHSVTLNYAEGCEGNIQLSLQNLRYAYGGEHLKQTLLRNGFDNGYIFTNDGVSMSLSKNPAGGSWTTSVYAPDSKGISADNAIANFYRYGNLNVFAFDPLRSTFNISKSGTKHLLFDANTNYESDLCAVIMLQSQDVRVQDLIVNTMDILYSDDIDEALNKLDYYTNEEVLGIVIYNNGDHTEVDDLHIVYNKEAEEYIFKAYDQHKFESLGDK